MTFHAVLMRLGPVLIVAAPAIASAQVVAQAIGLFNVFVGLMLTAALLAYFIGFAVWVVRLGTWPTYRTEAIKVMEWSVVILFVLVLILGIVQFVQTHPRAAGYVVATIVGALVLWAIIYMALHSGGGKKDDHA